MTFSPGDGTVEKIRKIVLKSADSGDDASGESANIREIRAMLIITLIVGVYFVGWIPTFVLFILTKLNRLTTTAFLTSAILNHLHSALNPFLYALNIKERKLVARRLLRRLVCCLV